MRLCKGLVQKYMLLLPHHPIKLVVVVEEDVLCVDVDVVTGEEIVMLRQLAVDVVMLKVVEEEIEEEIEDELDVQVA